MPSAADIMKLPSRRQSYAKIVIRTPRKRIFLHFLTWNPSFFNCRLHSRAIFLACTVDFPLTFFISLLTFFSSCPIFFTICAEKVYYKVCNTCYKLSNTCYKLCNICYKLCNKKFLIGQKKISGRKEKIDWGKEKVAATKTILWQSRKKKHALC